jgi:hypothetical protein
VLVERTSVQGTGCTEEDVVVATTITPEGVSFSIQYNSFEHHVGDGAQGLGVNCDVSVYLRLAPGRTLLPATVGFNGYASVVAGGEAAFKAVVYYDTDAWQRHIEKISGPFESDVSFSVPGEIDQQVQGDSGGPPVCRGELMILSIFTGLYGARQATGTALRLAGGNTATFPVVQCTTETTSAD